MRCAKDEADSLDMKEWEWPDSLEAAWVDDYDQTIISITKETVK
jgi:hypothetical protein